MRVSIHAPRAGRDFDEASGDFTRYLFQSTRPARGATDHDFEGVRRAVVSIHAPRAGRDASPFAAWTSRSGFNPRAPRGARLDMFGTAAQQQGFNPRAPRGARQDDGSVRLWFAEFQSTRPARGATRARLPSARTWALFQSTRPARGATRLFVEKNVG